MRRDHPSASSATALGVRLLWKHHRALVLGLLLVASHECRANARACPAASEFALQRGINTTEDSACGGSAASGDLLGCIGRRCRLCQMFATTVSVEYERCSPLVPGEAAEPPMVIGFDTPEPEPLSAARCPLTASLYDEAVGRNIVTDATCAGGGVGCVLKNCRYCRVHPTAVSQAYVSCSGFEPAATLTPTSSSGGSRPPTSPSANVVETPDTNFCSASLVDASQASAGVWAFVDEDGCAGDPANCQLGVCRFCKFTESPASSAYGACPDQGSESRWLISYAGSSV